MAFLTAQIEDRHKEALDAIAAERRVNRSIVVRWAIEDYIERFYLPARSSEVTNVPQEVQPVEATA